MHLHEKGLTGHERKRAYETVYVLESYRLKVLQDREDQAKEQKQRSDAMRHLQNGQTGGVQQSGVRPKVVFG